MTEDLDPARATVKEVYVNEHLGHCVEVSHPERDTPFMFGLTFGATPTASVNVTETPMWAVEAIERSQFGISRYTTDDELRALGVEPNGGDDA